MLPFPCIEPCELEGEPIKRTGGERGTVPVPKSASRVPTAAIFAALAFLLMGAQSAHAIPANPLPFDAQQPDGTRIRLLVRGDEYFHWLEDLDGYTVVVDGGQYAYAKLDAQGKLAPTQWLVGKADPRAVGLARRVLPPPRVRDETRASALAMPAQLGRAPVGVPPVGTVKNLVVLCKFSDHIFGTHTRPQPDYDTLFNAVGGDPTLAPTGSVRDCFTENSYGTMTLESTVAAWVDLPHSEDWYTNGASGLGLYPRNAQSMVEDALDAVDPLVDFSQFDNDADDFVDAIDFIHSGYGAEFDGSPDRIWSHSWSISTWTSDEGIKVADYHTEPALWGTSGTEIGRIGVIAHETGHFFGLPDLYDTDGGGEGVGSYGMMANSWGFDNTQLHPPHFCAWSKIFLGWIAPTVITAPDTYVAPQVETNPTAFRIDTGYPSGEYLLIENRQPVGFESVMPQGGLAIWHIDESKGSLILNDVNTDEGYPGQPGWPENNNHYRVALLQADGSYDLERGNNRGDGADVYHAGGVSAINSETIPNTNAYQDGIVIVTNNSISAISASGPSMTFTFDTVVPPPCIPVYSEDFELGLGDFTIDNTFGDGSGLWHLTTACESPSSGHSTPTSLYYGVDAQCDYDAGQSEGVATSPVVDLAGVSAPVKLSFNYFLETEGMPSSYDMASVEVSENGGPFAVVAHNDDSLPGVVLLVDPSGAWLSATVDLSAMAGSNVQVRFRFRTVDQLANAYEGFYVDDVEVCGACTAPPADFDGDCDVDVDDLDTLEACYNGPNAAIPDLLPDYDCPLCDLDGDQDVDLIDFGTFQVSYTGSL